MFRNSFRGKIILPAVIVLVCLTIVLTSYVSVRFLGYSNLLIDEKITTNKQTLEFYLNNGALASKAAAMSMAHNFDAVAAIKARDRKKILEIFSPAQELYNINYFTIVDENGTVLARTHAPDKFGDSVLTQQNVQDALSGKVSTYFESGTIVKVSARTGAPVYDTDGTLLGVISAGLRYDTNEVVDSLKNLFKSDITVFFEGIRISTTIRDKTGQRITGTPLDLQMAKIVIDEKTTYSGNVNIAGVRYKVVYMPLINAHGEVKAVFSVGHPLEKLESQAQVLIRNIIIISLIGLVISIAALYGVISTVSKPILDLVKEMDKMDDGQLTLVMNTNKNDEIGHAVKALQRVADTLRKLTDNLNIAISEQEKGNIEHHLDVHEFQGVYRLLVERIDKLFNQGLTDKLTGLPNRRSFDSRLDTEWHRATREQSPLSILMLDVDQFKTYNDTYGHQQGDIVLQTIAEAILLPLKRGYDFVARYGGEEFAVLLPNTKSAGATHVAEMIRAEIERTEVPCLDGGTAKKVTVSIGVGTLIPTPRVSIDKLVAHADAALYRAKETGRNRVCQYSDHG